MSATAKTAREVFVAAVKLVPQEWDAYLADHCGSDDELRHRVEALLKSHKEAGSFLGRPVPERLAEEMAMPAGTDATEGEAAAGESSGDDLVFLAPSAKPDSLGRLGHYEILEVIGRGGMGIVLRAFDEKLHRVVAIKVMAAQLATNATARKRFSREAQAAAAVSHDHIVTIHAVDEANGIPYLVMQFIDGVSLQERLDKSGALQLHEILRIGMQTASGLGAAHAQGLIHRDIKPANILLENGVERVKITDFGLARAATEASLTQSGVVAGTPQYMSPEQAEGKAIDQRTDLFSLGSVLYAMCTGRAPFRGSNSMAVLKRVCEEKPTPIRETNHEIPDWLVAIIDKLHAKDPAQRFQSATEVAELLGRHLAHVQHPSIGPLTPLSPLGRGAGGEGRSRAQPRRRLAVAAAVLLCLGAGLSLTEATGVTNLRATVIRVFTPDGTLVVEVDDPTVKVTVEGDGGLVITGAGLQEIRLRPGSYKVQAAKDGKPVRLDQELVTITRGDKQVVRVRLEGEAAAAKVTAKGEPGAFVVLGAKGAVERKFDTLADAVIGAGAGDTIEIRGNGPFVMPTIQIDQKALVIRAAERYQPVIESPNLFLTSNAPLVVEGLEFHRIGENREHGQVLQAESTLQVSNCRFVMRDGWTIFCSGPQCTVRNCFFTDFAASAIAWSPVVNGRMVVDNNIMSNRGCAGISLPYSQQVPDNVSIVLGTNTMSVGAVVDLGIERAPGSSSAAADKASPISLQSSANVFDARTSLVRTDRVKDKALPPAKDLLLPRLSWHGRRDLYSLSGAFVEAYDAGGLGQPLQDFGSLADWQRFWKAKESDSVQGRVRYQGGDPLAWTPEKLTPDDFRLRPDSPGYRAGKDGKDLGADIDLVGPGKGYERWKKTPEYQQWLKDTKQVKIDPPTGERQAFVLLGAKGAFERKLDTLAEAVLAASDGDTIEVRGTGPFVTEPIKIMLPLTIRAGDGFRPVIKLSPEAG